MPDSIAPRERAFSERRLARRFSLLIGLSVCIHLLFTPLGAWLGASLILLEQRPPEPPLTEQFEEVPIELSEFLAEPEPPVLPEQDPVAFIDSQLPAAGPAKPEPVAASQEIPATSVSAPDEPASPSASVSVSVSATTSATATSSSSAEATTSFAPVAASASGLPPSPEVASSVASVKSAAPAMSSSASRSSPEAAPASTEPAPKPRERIEDPVALAGRASALEKSPSSVAVTLYTDRIRSHPLGKRIAELLPRIPQWEDFFEGTDINPVRDFDRVAMFGPSFVNSGELVVALQYNVPQSRIRKAVDRLVQRKGVWLPRTPVPIARTYADRAERLILLPKKGFALIVPPSMQEQALKAKLNGVPAPKGNEALVFSIASPRRPLSRLGVDVPASISRVLAKVTPLRDGSAEISLIATDSDEESARQNAQQLTRSINAAIQLISGVSGVLSRLGLGGFAAGAQFEPIKLEAEGREIFGRQVLTAAQVTFILDRLERQLVAVQRPRP